MSTPLFSCVVPVKGARPFMDAALASLSAQEMDDDLEIIVQDGDVEPDAGQSDALNKGFAKANGEWLFWLNADDILLPGALRAVARVIASDSGVRWITGNEVFVDAMGRIVSCAVGHAWREGLSCQTVPHVYGPSSFFRRELFMSVGGCDRALRFCMDWDLWIRFGQQGARFRRLPLYLWAQRRWAGSKTQRRLESEEARCQWGEIDAMLRKNGFRVTVGGLWRLRLWRLLCGCYLREWVDTCRWRGRNLDALG